MEIVFWNCHQNGRNLNFTSGKTTLDVTALNETFLKPHMNFSLLGYDISRNDRTWSTKGSVAFLYKSELILNKVYDNNDVNIITNNKNLAIELELTNKTTLTLATIYCPDGKPEQELFRVVTSLSDKSNFARRLQFKTESL